MRSLFALTVLVFVAFASGCASQHRPNTVGSVEYDKISERAGRSTRSAEAYYDQRTPKTTARLNSEPPGALVEWQNSQGIWVTIGNTPTREVVIEGTGRPELFRISAPGFMTRTQWIAATGPQDKVEVTVLLDRELPSGYYVRDDGR
ncbi:MAG: hypothetical protein IT462_17085 [Planctomycetes bacterium]|nr:hypothetical protein [Planctomycetota bacterium]